MGEARERSAARMVVPVLAGLVLVASLVFALLAVRFAAMCEDQSTPDMVADCHQQTVWVVIRMAIAVVLATGASVVAIRARTATIAWKGGIVLLTAAAVASPLTAFIG